MMNRSAIIGIKRAFSWYLLSLLVMCFGTIIAARVYPGGFDWVYTVVSALASQKHNPVGSFWLAGALSIAMVLLWPYVSALSKGLSSSIPAAGYAIVALRTGLVCGALLGAEKLFIHDLSNQVYKAHEILALLTFAGLYIGILGLLVLAMLRRKIYSVYVLLVAGPLIAIGITQFWLYLDQRHLGWVDVSWRTMGIPFWMSFAFWQWLALVFLWLGLGLLAFIHVEEK
jgi:hypothetical protein